MTTKDQKALTNPAPTADQCIKLSDVAFAALNRWLTTESPVHGPMYKEFLEKKDAFIQAAHAAMKGAA